ncbi:MAG: VOC family protein, partial [bacterium]
MPAASAAGAGGAPGRQDRPRRVRVPEEVTVVRSSDAVDHLVLGAATLEEGIAWAERMLGATPQPGGRHPQWGTHNALLSLGHGAYLE